MGGGTGFEKLKMGLALLAFVTVAGFVVPVMSNRRAADPQAQALADLHRIAGALHRFAADTRAFPTGHSGATTFHMLYTSGEMPVNNVFASGPATHLYAFLVSSEMSESGWQGPYVDADIGPDPWGQAYLVNVNGFYNGAERALVVCAGPDGQINTAPSATIAAGDDLVLLLE